MPGALAVPAPCAVDEPRISSAAATLVAGERRLCKPEPAGRRPPAPRRSAVTRHPGARRDEDRRSRADPQVQLSRRPLRGQRVDLACLCARLSGHESRHADTGMSSCERLEHGAQPAVAGRPGPRHDRGICPRPAQRRQLARDRRGAPRGRDRSRPSLETACAHRCGVIEDGAQRPLRHAHPCHGRRARRARLRDVAQRPARDEAQNGHEHSDAATDGSQASAPQRDGSAILLHCLSLDVHDVVPPASTSPVLSETNADATTRPPRSFASAAAPTVPIPHAAPTEIVGAAPSCTPP